MKSRRGTNPVQICNPSFVNKDLLKLVRPVRLDVNKVACYIDSTKYGEYEQGAEIKHIGAIAGILNLRSPQMEHGMPENKARKICAGVVERRNALYKHISDKTDLEDITPEAPWDSHCTQDGAEASYQRYGSWGGVKICPDQKSLRIESEGCKIVLEGMEDIGQTYSGVLKDAINDNHECLEPEEETTRSITHRLTPLENNQQIVSCFKAQQLLGSYQYASTSDIWLRPGGICQALSTRRKNFRSLPTYGQDCPDAFTPISGSNNYYRLCLGQLEIHSVSLAHGKECQLTLTSLTKEEYHAIQLVNPSMDIGTESLCEQAASYTHVSPGERVSPSVKGSEISCAHSSGSVFGRWVFPHGASIAHNLCEFARAVEGRGKQAMVQLDEYNPVVDI